MDWLLDFILKIGKVGEFLAKVKDWLSGKKTYLLGIASIIAILIAYSQGDMGASESIKAIVAAIMAMTVRAGVTGDVQKSEKKLKGEMSNEKFNS